MVWVLRYMWLGQYFVRNFNDDPKTPFEYPNRIQIENWENIEIAWNSVKSGPFDLQNGKTPPFFRISTRYFGHLIIGKCSFTYIFFSKISKMWGFEKQKKIFPQFSKLTKKQNLRLSRFDGLHSSAFLVRTNRFYLLNWNLTATPAHPYFRPKSAEHDAILTSFMADWSRHKKSLVWMCEIVQDRSTLRMVVIRAEFMNLQGLLVRSSNWFAISSVEISSLGTSLSGKFVQFSSGHWCQEPPFSSFSSVRFTYSSGPGGDICFHFWAIEW